MVEKFPFLKVEGTHYEIGYQIGKCFKDRIKRFNEIIAGDLGIEEAKSRALLFLPAFRRDCPHLLEEIRGVADGAEISMAEALLPNIRGGIHRIAECTAYVISSEAAKEGKVLIGQNQDMPPHMQEVGVILHIIPEDAPEILMWTFAGLVGYHGFNSQGVSFFANSLPEPPIGLIPPEEIGSGYMVKRLMLEQSSIDGVLRVLDRMSIYESAFGQGNYVLADRNGILDVELYNGGYEVLRDDGRGFIAHTNHYVLEKLQHLNKYAVETLAPIENDSAVRLERMNKLLESAKGEVTTERLKEFLSDHYNYPFSICRHATEIGSVTVASIIAEPQNRVMHTCPGNPCEGEYYTYEMKD